jgi:dihydroorotase
MSVNPSNILNINKGSLATGADADIAIINLQKDFIVDTRGFLSKGKNSPFNGWHLKGTVEKTLSQGKIHEWS